MFLLICLFRFSFSPRYCWLLWAPSSRQSNRSANFERWQTLRRCGNAIYSVDLCTTPPGRTHRNTFSLAEMMVGRSTTNLVNADRRSWDVGSVERYTSLLLTGDCVLRPLQRAFGGQNLFQWFPNAFLVARIGETGLFEWRNCVCFSHCALVFWSSSMR